MQRRNLSNIPKALTRIDYEIPERYRNAFYLANAAFFDSSNWFLHRAYEVYFPAIKNLFRQNIDEKGISDAKLHSKVENIVESLDQCNSIIDVRFPIRRENGMLKIIRGFRAHYGESVQHAPCIGGLRIHENITRDHMKALSLLFAMKNSCLGIGLSGAMGGIKINPKNYSENELKNIISLYINEMLKKGYCNHGDIIQPDINTGEKEMKWISDAFTKYSGQHHLNSASTGKPLESGGIDNYYDAAAIGALKALETFINNSDITTKINCTNTGLDDKRFILQGIGKVGKCLGLLLEKSGAICVGVKDVDAYLYDSKGIDFKDLLKHKEQHGSIKNFGLSKYEFPDSIFTEDCDILVLAACQKSLACYVARDVKAKIVLEASDGPVTPTAHRILISKSKLVVPDIYASGGSMVASYFEYLRNLQQIGLSADNILRYSNELYKTMFANMNQNQQQRQMMGGISGGTQTSNMSLISSNFIENSLDCVYSEVGQEILKHLDLYKLGVDAKTAAYTVAIQNVFKSILKQKRLI
ncbi:glutamate dehydrogenase, mitochondrial-like [Anthonomus grandis grandis]|uniref:glutamate dehydrogenase, mitochondrial-like n=1 Tax=Anthonomus grandis grandis TaxID=2921223 RepID=UPI002166B539|nr:glutamate dehydrogenase, mitochondrial-like [Anthonomus grandis grandis]